MEKEQLTFDFIDYNFHRGFSRLDKLGIFFYDAPVLFGWEKKLGRRSYRFTVMLTADGYYDCLCDTEPVYELLNFIYTCNLKNFTKLRPAIPDFDIDERLVFDWEKLVSKAIPKTLEKAKERLTRSIKGKIPAPVIYKEKGIGFRENNEFLHFTNETAHNWAGPFIMGNKKGCIAIVGDNKHYKKSDYPILDVATKHRYYNLPYSIQKTLLHNEHYGFSDEQKAHFFNSLSVKDQLYTAKAYYKLDTEWFESCLPYRIYLAGNDDCSYTKWFATSEEMETEMNYLRKMQPLDYMLDIKDRGYIFTN